MLFHDCSLIQNVRATNKGSKLWIELLKAILFLLCSSILSDTLFAIVIEEMLCIRDEVLLSMIYLYWQIVVIGIVLLFGCQIQGRTLGFKTQGVPFQYLRGCLIGFLMFFAVVLVGAVLGAVRFQGLSEWLDIPLILLFLGGYLFQGMAEEMLCRGYILLSVARKNSIWSAILVSSLIFAIMHAFNAGFGLIPFINLFLFAVFEACYFLHTENIWGCSAIHSIWNFVQGCIFGFNVSGESLMPSIFRFSVSDNAILGGGKFGPEGGLAVTVVTSISILLIVFLKKGNQKKDG